MPDLDEESDSYCLGYAMTLLRWLLADGIPASVRDQAAVRGRDFLEAYRLSGR
jgi:hypothetical protein